MRDGSTTTQTSGRIELTLLTFETFLSSRTKLQERNYAANKTKQVAWFVSNCGAR